MTPLTVINWNVQWATPRSARTPEILRRIDSLAPEIVCLTEADEHLLSRDGYTITAQADYGYGDKGNRRKVMLWSQQPWRDVDDLGHESLTPGRFVSSVSATSIGDVMVMGICIPWFGSRTEARRGAERRERWGDHGEYLAGLTEILGKQTDVPLIILGDFNQVIGQGARAPVHLREALKRAFSPNLEIVTADVTFEGRRNIDHIALSAGLACEAVEPVSNLHDDMKLSDHYGIVATVSAVPSDA
ncbi:MAG: endonuclease/exonuclease/phosphatase family protein [Dehalococcoidia bacterium]|nr:endonuclease/exonuclease/phosphatase family protein [Dehalococcoidia bacterium]